MSSDAKMPVTRFMKRHFRHFNSAAVVDAAEAYRKHIAAGNKMLVTMGGAMSTAELGVSLAEMIREDKVHAIVCTGANLEEDLFNLVAHEHYERIPNYRDLTPAEEKDLLDRQLNRVTDTCIPEEEAMRRIERPVLDEWIAAEEAGERLFPHEYLYRVLNKGTLKEDYQIDPKDSWMLAAAERNLPLYVPGWEDSTLGNVFAGDILMGKLQGISCMKTGVEYFMQLATWYQEVTKDCSLGFFQIGGGITGDFAICVVPMLQQDMGVDTKLWSYFCQISDSTTSYGSYSGAPPNEKITWGKLGEDTPRFMIESDATIVAPLLFGYVLGK